MKRLIAIGRYFKGKKSIIIDLSAYKVFKSAAQRPAIENKEPDPVECPEGNPFNSAGKPQEEDNEVSQSRKKEG